jgi:hypothetical protein
MPNSNTKRCLTVVRQYERGAKKGWDVMTTPNQPTFPQICSFLEYLKKQNVSVEKFQKFIESGDLVTQMLNCPDLSMVDKEAFSALLFPKPTLNIPWTPINKLVSRVMKRSKKRLWGFTDADAEKLTTALNEHNNSSDLYPTSVRLWLGGTLKYNWTEMMLWIREEVEALGYEFTEDFDVNVNQLKFFFLPGSEISGNRSLSVVNLDLKTYWKPESYIVAEDELPKRKKWPSLEVATLLALNPQVYVLMDNKIVPNMLSAGLVLDSRCLPGFLPGFGGSGNNDRRLCVYCDWGRIQSYDSTIASFG